MIRVVIQTTLTMSEVKQPDGQGNDAADITSSLVTRRSKLDVCIELDNSLYIFTQIQLDNSYTCTKCFNSICY